MSVKTAIQVEALEKRYGDCLAVRSLSFAVQCGCMFGFVGPNGAGKTTTIRCISGTLAPSGGTVTVLGLPLACEPLRVKQLIGVMPEGLALFDQLRCSEFLVFNAEIFGIDKRLARSRTNELLEAFDLTASDRTRILELSQGTRKKVAFAAAVIHSPQLLFLDEPFEGMDPATVAMLKGWLRHYVATGRTVFITTHILSTVQELCDDLAIINKGELAWHGQLDGHSPFVYQNDIFDSVENLFLAVTGRKEATLSWL